ncbi:MULTISPECIES: ABC transporter ATP-binding protein [unclassified Nocardiopsis]|uniref:ABC transporter ATP-binding protein n=1 Tax=unclassified Nocardiopsis TaxID=2649073 RepID=UPI00135CB073|nr:MULTISPECIES: ABC transporter ATP-binding protein [unclassified Nocardiopsis]
MRLSHRGKLRRSSATATAPAPPLVELHDVSLVRARARLLDHLDLAVHPGEHVALVGLDPDATTALTHVLTGRTTPTYGRLAAHTGTRLLTPHPRPTLGHALTGQMRPDPADPHLTPALAAAGLDPAHLRTPLADLDPDLRPRLERARDLYATRTDTRLLLLTDPPPEQPAPAPTPGTGLLLTTRHPARARTADRVLLLCKGRVTETGTHHQLLVRGGAYARLYALTGTHRTTRGTLG